MKNKVVKVNLEFTEEMFRQIEKIGCSAGIPSVSEFARRSTIENFLRLRNRIRIMDNIDPEQESWD